jgi:RNA polymerase sigma-70 factor, ECF subfamily
MLGKYRPLIFEIVMCQMGDKLRAVFEPEDVVQDVMLSAYRGMGDATFFEESDFESWLRVLAKNRLIDLDRRHFKTARRPANVQSLDETVDGSRERHRGDEIVREAPGPSTIVGRREMAERLLRALGTCRAKDRELVCLAFIENLSINEIAARLGKKPAAVRKALSRAIDACREAILLLPPSLENRRP